MSQPATEVDAVFFDFDGVIADSVDLKEKVFRGMMERHAAGYIEECMAYYQANGGVSRIVKFREIWADILKQPLDPDELDHLGKEFSESVFGAVVACELVRGAGEFLEEYHRQWPFFVLSGTPEPELQAIVRERGMERFFRGVHGSPPNKIQIGERILADHGFDRRQVWFIGDATTDRDAARGLRTRFVGIDGPHLTPFLDGAETVIEDLTELHDVLTTTTG